MADLSIECQFSERSGQHIHIAWGEGEKKFITGHGGGHPPIASD
jgi:hypothetical protein